jgi:glycosyltransferase involved in cell wall biosynthesis
MGLAVVEALMCGTPVVASYLPALYEVLGSDSAIYVARNDVAGLADAIRQIVANPEFAEKISAKSRDNYIGEDGK